jgi:hypothetical protein
VTTIDFGHDWLLPDGRRGMLSWYPFSGELVLHKPSGRDDVLAVIGDEVELRRRLEGYEHHAFTRSGLSWLTAQLDGVR